ncbi:hypothetical protein [Amphritea sp. HPY]|uniref:hypothetical protein n=1 Tax=Amphritea sp. HPY TaxID=3421652 RepID=UPI003D7E37E9
MTKLNTSAIEFRILDKKLADAETVLISLKELNVDPKFQMREKMDHENIALYAESLEDLPPVRVFEVGNRLILTDGFHRFFAHELAEAEDIKAKVVKGTEFEAMSYAMAANFAHLKGGSKPSSGDQRKAIETMCELLADKIGYDSKQVVPTLVNWGITCSISWARKCTKDIRAEIDAKRDAAISNLTADGMSSREVAERLGCSDHTVRMKLKEAEAARKEDSAEISQEESPFNDESDNDDMPWGEDGFSEDELESAPVVNPADAMKKTLDDFDATLQQDTANTTAPSIDSSVVPTDGNTPTVEENTPRDEVAGAFNLLAEAWKVHGPDAFEEFLEDTTEVNDSNVEFFLKIAGFVANRRA